MGRHLLLLAAEGFETYGSDVSPTAVETCRRRLREAGLSAGVTRSDMTAIPYPDGFLDAVIAWHVVYHGDLKDIHRAINGVRDKLDDGGYFLVTFISTADGQCARSRDLAAEGRAVEVEPGTFMIPEDTTTDKALPHHYSTEQEIRESFLCGFDVEWLREQREPGSDFEERGYRSVHWQALARKPA
jgi:cyclopropane fatty-acyl-phospholipid synthase-like methyltransferase